MDKWDYRFLRIAREVSTWSKDPSTAIGAVAADDEHRILSQGYNGFPRGIADDNRLNDRPTKYALVVHAEMNVIYNASLTGVSLKNSTLYVYGLPVCSDCAKGVIQSGIKRVVVAMPDNVSENWSSHWLRTKIMFEETNIEINSVLRDQIDLM